MTWGTFTRVHSLIALRYNHMMFCVCSKSMCMFVENWLADCLGILEVLTLRKLDLSNINFSLRILKITIGIQRRSFVYSM